MKKINTKAFTLIELLVVITIIGILATGAVSVFTTQLQGARDATRISDMKVMESALNQIFNDDGKYPTFTNSGAFKTDISKYMSKTLKDPKAGITVCWTNNSSNAKCQGVFASADDTFGLPNGSYKIGVKFEKESNYKNKAANTGKQGDGGNSEAYYEIFSGAGGSGITLSNSGAVY